MAIIAIPQSQAENKETYQSEYLKWKGFVDRIPILNSILVAKAAAVTASWRTYGKHDKTMADILDGVKGNGKQTFKQLMNNANMVSTIGGDCYFEIITNSDLDIENIVMLPPDNIRIRIKNGEIKKYEELNGNGKWDPKEILHFSYSPLAEMVHGRSIIENMNNLLIDYLQLLDTGTKIFEHFIKPREIVYVDTDSPAKLSEWATKIREINQVPKAALVVPKGTVEVVSQPLGGALNPQVWQKVLLDNMLMSARVSENILGIGTQNSEESARMQMAGFAQMVRFEQKWMEETLKSQLFALQYPDNVPGIRFSFGIEAQDERFNRIMQSITTLSGSALPEDVKFFSIVKQMKEAGLVNENA